MEPDTVTGTASGHAGGRHRWRLALSFGLVLAFFVVELTFGLLSGSLALLSDAGHMAADVVALGAALVATKIATRPDATGRRSYGSYRAEVFASGLTVLLMLGVSAYVVIEAVARIGSEVEVQTGPMLVVGAIGLVINVISPAAPAGRRGQESLNVKGAYSRWSPTRPARSASSLAGVAGRSPPATASGTPSWRSRSACSWRSVR